MRAFDRDLIRGGHYGQRYTALKGRTHGCTDQACDVKILLANTKLAPVAGIGLAPV
jgi:hypothetical protein